MYKRQYMRIIYGKNNLPISSHQLWRGRIKIVSLRMNIDPK